MPGSDNFSPDDMDMDGAMDMDFESKDEDAGIEPAEIKRKASTKKKSAPTDIYTVLLIISAFFYLLALAATLAEMSKYCVNFLWLG